MRRVPRTDAGFSLVEMLIAMTVMLVVLAGTAQMMFQAIQGESASSQVIDMNGHLRAAMDLIQRDLLQTGQGLPIGRRVGVPNGPDARSIARPGPAATDGCDGVGPFPGGPSVPAVSVGPNLGPAVDGVCTDVITILAADNLFGKVPVASIAADGRSAIIHGDVNIADDPDVASDNVRAGDLLLFEKGAMSVLVQVTSVDGQTVEFGSGAEDPLGLNQFDANVDNQNLLGTLNLLKAEAPADPDDPEVDEDGAELPGPSLATRIRMITYFVEIDAPVPRLMRQAGGALPNAVAIGVQAFRLNYDIADQANNPTNVRMNADDVAGRGACPDDPGTAGVVEACSENQIRKVNVVLSMQAAQLAESRLLEQGNASQSTLYAQVSLRSLAFVDRYQ